MILAGDIGGTKTILALYQKQQNKLTCIVEKTYASSDYTQFQDLLTDFLSADVTIDAACFGVAGPVVNQRCQTTNLPWLLVADELAGILKTPRVKLLNDLEAMAVGMLNIPATDLLELNPHGKAAPGNIAVIAAGTGLGQAILYRHEASYLPMATEGGHCDFAPQTAQQDRLLGYLRHYFKDHVSWERILSGDGFGYLYDFLIADKFAPPCSAIPTAGETPSSAYDRNASISRLGINNEDPLCAEAVRLFVELYGAEAGNLALKSLSTGGVFIGGGIAPKIRPAMENGQFIRAFTAKGRFQDLLSKIPVKLSLNQNTPLIGAANYFRHS